MSFVRIDAERIRRVAAFLKTFAGCSPSDWTFEGLPPVQDPWAADYFFLTVKHQYGFWLDDGEKYTEPMYGVIGGQRLKGSDFVWHAIQRAVRRDASIYNIEKQSSMSDGQIFDIFADDSGRCPLPMFETHCEIWRRFARDMLERNWTPGGVVESCRRDPRPVESLLRALSSIGGYKEDPLAKKAALLAIILANRPEHFIPAGPFPPIVDYHIQRSALRVGLVRIDNPEIESRIRGRKMLGEEEESAVRAAVYEAMKRLEEESGKGIAALDWFFFQNRRRCPEMTDPDCPRCEIESVCARRKDLFQPVRRTTFY